MNTTTKPNPPKNGDGTRTVESQRCGPRDLDHKKGKIMKISSVTTMIVSLAAIMLFASGANAGGLTSMQLERAGYFCFVAGPNDWIHCLLERKLGDRAVSVKVFSEDGMMLLGTEQLLREDVYLHGKPPCPQNGLDEWDFGGFYYACHHFDTG